MIVASAVLFLVHAVVASIDGVYFHIRKYKLYAYEDTIIEHVTHTLRAWTMVFASFLLYVLDVGGWLLWAAVAVMIIDLLVETWDVLIERKSRERFGGLSSSEYLVHAHSIALYAAAFALAFASKDLAAWSLSSPPILAASYPWYVVAVGWAVGLGSLSSAVQHMWLCLPRYREVEV